MDLVLNKRQQELAEENHNLIYWYAKAHKLNLDDYYGDLAIELCRAAYNYDEGKGCAFAAYATKCMDNKIKKILQKRSRTIEGSAEIISLNYTYFTDESDCSTLGDCVANYDESIEDVCLFKIEAESFLKTLSDREKHIFKGIARGETQDSLGEELGISQQRVYSVVKKVRNKWNKRGEK